MKTLKRRKDPSFKTLTLGLIAKKLISIIIQLQSWKCRNDIPAPKLLSNTVLTNAQNTSFQTLVYLKTLRLPSVMFVYPTDEILFSRPSARSLEELQRIHSSRWGVLVSAIQANICPRHSASANHLRFNRTKERFERQKALERKLRGFST